MAIPTQMYVHSPGSGPYSLRSLTAPAPRVPVKKPVANVKPRLTPAVRVAAKPPTDAQLAQTQVSAAFDPVLKQITDAFNQRAAAQQNAITGYSKTLADLMGSYAPESRAAYTGAAAGQSAIDASLAATREGQGAGAQADLAKRLADLHADPATASRIAGGFTGDLAGEANATAARGGANLAMLLGEGAHAQEYGAKLPGIAAGMGLGATERAQGQITNEMRAALSELAAKRPDAFQAALANISSTRQKQEQLNLENSLAAKKYGLDVTKAGASIAQGNARIGIAQQNANTSAARAAQQALNSDRNYGVQLAKIGISKKSLQLRAATQEAKLKGGGFTPAQVQRYKGTALTLADQAFNGFTDAKGNTHPPLQYKQAVLEGQKEGIPLSILLAQLEKVGYVSPGDMKKVLAGIPSTPLGG